MARSMRHNEAAGLSGMLKEGYKHFQGVEEAVLRNIEAAKQISVIVQTSYGPHGLNKLIINHQDKTFITNDTATIVRELEVVHPAARILAITAITQSKEFGDGTNYVITLAGELLKRAAELVNDGVHPSDIVTGYRMALGRLETILPALVSETRHDLLNEANLTEALQPVLAAKLFGYEDILAPLVAKACLLVQTDAAKLSTDHIRIAKIPGPPLTSSFVLPGMILLRDTEGAIKRLMASDCKPDGVLNIAMFGCGIESSSTETKSTVVLRTADELMKYNRSEEDMIHEFVASLSAAKIHAIVSGGSVSDMAIHYLNRYQIMVFKVPSKWDMKRIAETTRATVMTRLGVPTLDEVGSIVGTGGIEVMLRGNMKMISINSSESRIASICISAATEQFLNHIETALTSAVSVTKAILQDGRFVNGAGACEFQLSQRLKASCKTGMVDDDADVSNIVIRSFATAFEVFPRLLAQSSGGDASAIMANLVDDVMADVDVNAVSSRGINVELGRADRMNVKDSFAVKMNAIQLAVEASLTILRVDEIVMAKQAGGPKMRDGKSPDDDD